MDHESGQLENLKGLSLENLLDLEVVSVSRKQQKLSDTAAAIYVIDQEEIRRSGATSIPELLRMVPGLHVAHINGNSWSVSSRGFSGRFSNKLLVLMDGRSVYTPLYSGVYWDVQDTILGDIERIEVIRGPGASIWGANAVNGVINIITKSAHETQGNQLKLVAGNEEQGMLEFRHGAQVSDATSYRFYLKGFERDESVKFDGTEAHDDWDARRVGFRLDSALSITDDLTVQGQLYTGDSGQTINIAHIELPDVSENSGGNLQLNWTRKLSALEQYNVQTYFDRTNREDRVTSEQRDTFDIEFRHYFPLTERQQLSWGSGYRHTRDTLEPRPGSSVSFHPQSRSDTTWSAFLQDEIAMVPDKLTAIVGTKLEHNNYTGWEWQPTLRLSWMQDKNTSIWGAVSRAIRTPSRVEEDARIAIPVYPVGQTLLGNTQLDSEELMAYELGLRRQFTERLSLDATIFYDSYDNLRSIEFQEITAPDIPPYYLPGVAPGMVWAVSQVGNGFRGHSYGLEVSADWLVNDHWKLSGSYSWLDLTIDHRPGSNDTLTPPIEGAVPEHQFQLRSRWNIAHDLEFDTTVYFVDELKDLDVSAYTRLDLRLGWHPSPELETSLVLQNVLDSKHPEYQEDEGLSPRQVERGIFAQVNWKF
jgi:iron complex outermembrane receptor protein